MRVLRAVLELIVCVGWFIATTRAANFTAQVPTTTTGTNGMLSQFTGGRMLGSTAVQQSGLTNLLIPGYITLGGTTNRISDDGSNLTRNGTAIGGGGGGGNVLSSSATTNHVVPRFTDATGTNIGPTSLVANGADRQLTFTSHSPSANTNIAVRINTISPWTDVDEALFLSGDNAGTNTVRIDVDGGLWSGRNAYDEYESEEGSPGVFLVGRRNASLGDVEGAWALDWGGSGNGNSFTNASRYYVIGNTNGLSWILENNDATGVSRRVQHYLTPSGANLGNLYTKLVFNGVEYVRLEPSSEPTATPYILRTMTNHTSGNLLEVANNTTNKFTVAALSGYTGAGTLFLSDDGTYKSAGGGTTINATDGVLPYRSNATTFSDSPVSRTDADSVLVAGDLSIGSITNTLLRSGSDLVYTNADTAINVILTNASTSAKFGLATSSGNAINLELSGTKVATFYGATLDLPQFGGIAFMNGDTYSGSALAQFRHEGSGVVGLNNGTSSQSFRIYNSTNSGTGDYSRFSFATSSTNFMMTPQVGGAGTALYTKLVFDEANNVWDGVGVGTPEGVFTAGVGSLFRRSDGGSGTTLYSKESGTGNTGWSNLSAGGSGDFVGPASSTANDVLAFSDGTGKLGKVTTSAATFGNASSATFAMTFNLSGATDPVFTAANSTMALSTALTLPVGTTSQPSLAVAGVTNTGFNGVGATEMRAIINGASSHRFTASALDIAGTGAALTLGSATGTGDTVLMRDAAATLQLGADAATATAQTLKAHDGSGTDKNGADITIGGGQSTGTGIGGATITKTSLTGATGSSKNGFSTRRYEYAGEKTLTESTATIVANIALASSKYLGGRITATTHADDATDFQAITDDFTFSAINKAGTVTATIQATPSTSATAASTGTLTTTWTIVANGATVDIKNSAVSSLTQTTLKTKWVLELNSDDVGTVTP